MQEFTRRLKNAMRDGDLTVADLARLFDRERRTVSSWVHDRRMPTGARAEEAHDRLSELEMQIRKQFGFPVPFYLTKRDRTAYVRLLREGKLERARLLAAGSPRERLVRGVRQKGRRTPPAVIQDDRRAAQVATSLRPGRV